MPSPLIQCVVVLYRCAPGDSKTLESLAGLCERHSDLARRIALLIYDNSPSAHAVDLHEWDLATVEYHHDGENGGLAPAYNQALQFARQQGMEWLLLLDQDTSLAPELFPALFAAIASPQPSEICAIVPKLMRQGRVLSPQKIGRFHNTAFRPAFTGIPRERVTAFNSSACLRVESLNAIGGFAPEYPIEFLDHIMFHRLQTAGGRALILDVVIQHDLSLLNLEAEMGPNRHERVLRAEWKFVRETGYGGGPLVHRLRLFKRALHHAVTFHDKTYALQVLRAALK